MSIGPPERPATNPASGVALPAHDEQFQKPWWGPAETGIGFLAAGGALLVALFIVGAVVQGTGIDTIGANMLNVAGQGVAFIAVPIAIAAMGLTDGGARISRALRGLGLRKPNRRVASSIAIAILLYVAASVAIALTLTPRQQDLSVNLGADRGGLYVLATGFFFVVLAPLSEEILFRGFLFGGLRKSLPFWVAALIPSVIFGSLHLVGATNVAVALQLAVLGVIFCFLYERTNSIWPAIGLHGLNNALAFAFLLSS